MQKQPPELFSKNFSQKLPNIHRKPPVLESPFNSEYCEILKSAYFKEHLRMVASENVFMKLRKIKNFS